jgi:hypothetical protein
MKLGNTAELEGAVKRIDETAGTVMVEGQELALAETAVTGVPLDQLQQGEEDFGGSAAGMLAHLRRYGAPPLAARLARRSTIDDYAYD